MNNETGSNEWATLTTKTSGAKLAWIQARFPDAGVPCLCVEDGVEVTVQVREQQLQDMAEMLEAMDKFDDDDVRWLEVSDVVS